MKNILLRGPFLTHSGYGVHSRQIAKWALTRKDWNVDIQATPWGMTSWYLNDDGQNGLVGKIMEKTVPMNHNNRWDMSIQVQLPNEWDPNLASVNVGVTAAVETDRCNPAWIDACNNMSVIVVPTTFTKRTLERSGKLNVPIIVIPESYYNEIEDEGIEPLQHDFSTKFNFLVFGQLTGNNPENDRKNLAYTIKWMCEEFRDKPDVGIIVKTNSGRSTKIDRLLTERFLSELIENVRKGPYPRIHMLHGKMSNEEMVALYRNESVKALVSLTRGEGFGLPLLEAAAAGIPVIATNWSGHKDFLGRGKFIAIDYDLQPIHPSRVDGQIFIQGSRWANPKESDAKRKLRKFYERSSLPEEWAKDLSTTLKNEFSDTAISKLYDLHVGSLL